ncbi:MAG: PepSY-like domain-containing protein [Bacteroidales bacterium]|nr:PepSY-like domain-containing protein [Bacteroidales bacterium]
MYKMLLMAVLAFASVAPAQAEDDRPIAYQQLPQAAQNFVSQHFKGSTPSLTKEERGVFHRSYEVLFTNGNKIEFDRSGRWTDIDCRYSQVPASVVPVPIAQYVKQHFPNVRIVELQRERRGYSVDLSNKIELDFDKRFRLTKWDN